jgi:drug/metabolite transporter (DMT)-like permease
MGRMKDDGSPGPLEPTDHSLVPSPQILVLIAVLLWSTGGVFIKLTTVDAYSVNLGRSFFAALTVAVYLFYKKALKFDWFSVLSGIFYAATLSSFVYANKNTSAANAIFLQYTAPVYILLLAPLLIKERMRRVDLFTVAACLGGMALFFFDANQPSSSGGNNTAGIIAGLISGLSFGIYFVLLRHPRGRQHDPSLSVLTGNLIIVFAMIPFVLSDVPDPRLNDFLAIGYLGVVQIGLAYLLFTYGVSMGVRSLDASIIGFFEPLLNPVWVFLFVGEIPSIWTIAGGTVILAAVLLHTILISRQKAAQKRRSSL